jgi:hypothetical protein
MASVITSGPDAGRVIYTAEAGFAGIDSFTYTISDGALAVTGTVTVVVSAAE